MAVADPTRTPQGIAGDFARRIRAGELAPDDRLPTVRDVAAELGVSPATVSQAWQALRRAGLVVSRGRAGSYVASTPRRWLSPRQQGLLGSPEARDEHRLDLSRGTPDPGLLPDLGPALAGVADRAWTEVYQDEPVLPALRDRLMASWPYPAESLTVVDGALDGLSRTLEQLVSFGDRVVVENPGFPPTLDLVEALGAEPVPVRLDAHGVRPVDLRKALATRPAAVVLQPRAHNPTGVSMTAARSRQLAGVLRQTEHRNVVVVEDDHSGSISIAPDVSLGRWLPDRVVHVRSYSKSHGPDLRIAALGGPSAVVDRLVARRMLGPGWTSRMIQTILLDLLTAARPIEQVAEARRQYFARQRALVTALAERGVRLPQPDGINLWLPVPDERAALVSLAAAGIRAAGGSVFLTEPAQVPRRPGPGASGSAFVRVTSGLVTADHVDQVASALAHAADPAQLPR